MEASLRLESVWVIEKTLGVIMTTINTKTELISTLQDSNRRVTE